MKVVLFCGGLGMRIREAGENVPKPMVTVGYRPILWHVMKYYAHFGHKDFVLCLGYRGDVIKDYFLNYSECLSNDFVLSEGGKKLELMASDIHDWKISFVETGATSNIGQRLKAVERLLRDEPEFLANYSDGLSDLYLPDHIDHFRRLDAVASFVTVKPNLSYHLVSPRTAASPRSTTSARPRSGSTAASSCSRTISSATCATARSSSSSRSSGWSVRSALPPTSTTASGCRW